MNKVTKQQLIVKPTLEQIARHGNIFPEPIVDGGFDDYEANSYLNQALGGAAVVGLLTAASKSNHSRRTFLKALGLTAAGAGLSSCAAGFIGGGTTTYESPNFRFYLPKQSSS